MASDFSSIADASKPNAGRIYDFLLGGHHNFEIDRQAAEQVLSVAPFMPRLVRLIRWFLGEAISRLCEDGFHSFLDFASGLPTVDHIHQVAPSGTKVIYSDIDPITVAYAQEIIGDNPNIRYVLCDAGRPEDLLNSTVVTELFGSERQLVIGFNGIAWFISDDAVRHAMTVLYDWAEPGTKLFLCDGDASQMSEEGKAVLELYRRFGQRVYARSLHVLEDLIKPWKVQAPGFQLLEEWVDMEAKVTEEIKGSWSGGGFVGAILRK